MKLFFSFKPRFLVIICSLALSQGPVAAHPDLDLQISGLTEQLETEPGNTELLIKRGDLHRRHGEWAAGKADFQRVRTLQADHPMVDWYEGRLLVEEGRYGEGDALLTRFLSTRSDHGGAFRARAIARWHQNQPLQAAEDFQSAIDNTQRPSPSLFRAVIVSLVSSGREHTEAAQSAAKSGLGHFSQEISLLGLAVDLSLSQSDTRQALIFMMRVPRQLSVLNQWKYRRALWKCIEGETEAARAGLQELLPGARAGQRQKAGTWDVPVDTVNQLIADTSAEQCANAAWETLLKLQP